VTALRDFFERDPHGCLTVYLFGSRARDDFHESSDVDVAVLWETEPADALDRMGVGLKIALEDVLDREVDVVILHKASLDVAQRVIRDGVIVLDRDRASRVGWEVKTRSLFLDIRPTLLAYRRMSA